MPSTVRHSRPFLNNLLMSDRRSISLTTDYIELFKVLKIECLASSGAEAKRIIEAGMVRVNDERELRKRKKLVPGDRVEYHGEVIFIDN